LRDQPWLIHSEFIACWFNGVIVREEEGGKRHQQGP
jgi:hypothetical protein